MWEKYLFFNFQKLLNVFGKWPWKTWQKGSYIGEHSAKKIYFFPGQQKNCEKISPIFSLSEVKNYQKLFFWGKFFFKISIIFGKIVKIFKFRGKNFWVEIATTHISPSPTTSIWQNIHLWAHNLVLLLRAPPHGKFTDAKAHIFYKTIDQPS